MVPSLRTPSALSPRNSVRFVMARAARKVLTTSTRSGKPTTPVVTGGPGGSLVSGREACFAQAEMPMPMTNADSTIKRPWRLSRSRA
jgi:hypothetical protein